MLVRVTRTKGRRLPAALGVVAAVVLATTVAGAAVQASPAQAQPAGQTVVSFAWGGGFRNQLGALPVFRRYGMHATFFVPSGLVCQPAADPGCMQLPYLTLGNIRQIAANGNEIGGLSVEHVPFSGLPAAEIQREICNDRLNLTRWGFQVSDFAYPFALASHAVQDLTRRCGYNSGLGAGQLRGAGLCPDCAFAETIPPANPYLVRAPIEVSSVGTSWTPATFEKIVNDARDHGGGWVIFTIHDVCASACSLGVTLPELTSVLSWLSRQASHGVSVRTIRQVIGGPVRPAVAGPAPPRIPPPGVKNSRMSVVAAGGVPACFQTVRYGANHATFRYSRHGGPGGDGAESVALTARKSGTAQVLPALDLGACAPGVSAGHSYAVGAWYKSSMPVAFNVYYRTPVGTWRFWAASPVMPAARTWTKASWTPPKVPQGASAVSFGLALNSDGTVAASRFSLVPARQTNTSLAAFAIVAASFLGLVLLGGAITVTAISRRRRRKGPGADPG